MANDLNSFYMSEKRLNKNYTEMKSSFQTINAATELCSTLVVLQGSTTIEVIFLHAKMKEIKSAC